MQDTDYYCCEYSECEDLFFFFSSRRRHTRCGRDWSSDVCSSDLCARRGRCSFRPPDRRVKFGVQLPHFGPLASGEGTLALARRAEALGYDSVWVGDHIVYGLPPALLPKSLEEVERVLAAFAGDIQPRL